MYIRTFFDLASAFCASVPLVAFVALHCAVGECIDVVVPFQLTNPNEIDLLVKLKRGGTTLLGNYERPC